MSKKNMQQALDALERNVQHKYPKSAHPEQEDKLPEMFCGVDYSDGMLSVSVMRRRPDDVAELLHSEMIELAQPVQPAPHRQPLTVEEIYDVFKTICDDSSEMTFEYMQQNAEYVQLISPFARAIEAKLGVPK